MASHGHEDDKIDKVHETGDKHADSSQKTEKRLRSTISPKSQEALNQHLLEKNKGSRFTVGGGHFAVLDQRNCPNDTVVTVKNRLPEAIQSKNQSWERDAKNPQIWHIQEGSKHFELKAEVKLQEGKTQDNISAKVRYENGREVTFKNGEPELIKHPNGEIWKANPKNKGSWEVTSPNNEDPEHPHRSKIKGVKVDLASGDIKWQVTAGDGSTESREITADKRYIVGKHKKENEPVKTGAELESRPGRSGSPEQNASKAEQIEKRHEQFAETKHAEFKLKFLGRDNKSGSDVQASTERASPLQESSAKAREIARESAKTLAAPSLDTPAVETKRRGALLHRLLDQEHASMEHKQEQVQEKHTSGRLLNRLRQSPTDAHGGTGSGSGNSYDFAHFYKPGKAIPEKTSMSGTGSGSSADASERHMDVTNMLHVAANQAGSLLGTGFDFRNTRRDFRSDKSSHPSSYGLKTELPYGGFRLYSKRNS